jgi:hypothetical protein
MDDAIPEARRRELFAALVEAQDGGLGVVASREHVAAAHGVTAAQVQAIEKEGLKAQWPPLG